MGWIISTSPNTHQTAIKNYKDSNAIVKKIDCVNSNTNINGLNGEDTDTLSEPVVTGSLATLPTEQDIGVDNNAYENSERNNRYNNNEFDCINNNNNAGGQGPQGPTGATGPPGINVIDSSNYYSVVGESGIISTTGEGASSFASCDDGDFAISGAYRIGTATATTGAGTYDVRFFGAIGILPSGTWQTFIVGLEGTQVRTTVNCFDNPPLRP